MAVRLAHPPRAARPPRAMAWVLLLVSAVTVLTIGALATALVFGTVAAWSTPPPAFWWRLIAASVLTSASLSVRSLRWIFLLRRAETRIPIRDAYIGYFAGLSLLFAPLLLGEIAVRAWVNRARGDVPITTTVLVNLWERVLDLVAIGSLAALSSLALGMAARWTWIALVLIAMSFLTPLRLMMLRAMLAVVSPVVRVYDGSRAHTYDRLAGTATWAAAVATSLGAWLMPGMGLWLIANSWGSHLSIVEAERVYTHSVAAAVLYLAPGGVLIAGPDMMARLSAHGVVGATAALAVLGIRLATVGVSVAMGVVFVVFHLRTASASSAVHFDDIADAYDVQIPESRRHALLARKTAMMDEVLRARGAGRRGLDVGCGQGAYVARMRSLGFDVSGIDASAGQVQLAARKLADAALVRVGSVLAIPEADSACDFLYVINVLHHLGSVEQQRQAFAELFRVLKPGGVLFLHEINTRNILFRFYMGYIFPSLNCIDEGVERWLMPNELGRYTDIPAQDIRYFTFLPDFVPHQVAQALRPLERALEASALRVYSAHYMAVLVKPGSGR